MKWCSKLKKIDLAPLHAVEVLPEGFLFGCSGLQEVDLSTLVNLREVGSFFLGGCNNLKRITLSPTQDAGIIPHRLLGFVSTSGFASTIFT